MTIQRRFALTKHFITAIGWVALFCYSTYLLLEKMLSSKPYTIVHLIAPLVLVLVSVRAIRRYRMIRSLA